MRFEAYLKDETLYVDFRKSSPVYSEIGFPIGDAMTQFSGIPREYYEKIVCAFRDECIINVRRGESEAELLEMYGFFAREMGINDAYLYMYMNFLAMFYGALRGDFHQTKALLPMFLLDNGEGVDIDGQDFADKEQTAIWAANVFFKDIQKRQILLKEDLEAIISEAEAFKGLAPLQRLYLLSKQEGRNYLSGDFNVTLATTAIDMPDGDAETIKAALLEKNVDVVEKVAINTLDDLMRYEMYHTLKRNLIIRKCKHCGEFFIVRGRIDMEYCGRTKVGETKPCNIIGATRTYWNSKDGDPVYAEFQKAYKRNHSRQRVGKMTQSEFYEWSEEARRKRSECDAGKMTVEDFKAWLGNKR